MSVIDNHFYGGHGMSIGPETTAAGAICGGPPEGRPHDQRNPHQVTSRVAASDDLTYICMRIEIGRLGPLSCNERGIGLQKSIDAHVSERLTDAPGSP
jgi:hypothetical protein